MTYWDIVLHDHKQKTFQHRVRLVFFLIGAEFTGNAVTVAQEAAKKTGGTFVQVQNPQDVVDLGIADVDAKKALGDDASAEMTGKDDKEDNNLVLILALSVGGLGMKLSEHRVCLELSEHRGGEFLVGIVHRCWDLEWMSHGRLFYTDASKNQSSTR